MNSAYTPKLRQEVRLHSHTSSTPWVGTVGAAASFPGPPAWLGGPSAARGLNAGNPNFARSRGLGPPLSTKGK